MALPISIIISVLVFYTFLFIRKRLSFIQNSIVFMIMAILTKNYMTIMTMELKRFKTTEDDFLFMFLLLHREIILPIVVLIFSNIYLKTTSGKKILFLFLGVLAFMHAMNVLSVQFRVVEFVEWNFIFQAIVDIAFLFMGVGLAKFLLYLHLRESLKNDSSI